MLRIGQFARLSQVTIKTLHHYDELGLLRPNHTDGDSGYRFYALEQLPQIHRIMALKELGFSLDQVKLLLDGEVTAGQIREMLRLKQSELQSNINEEQARLAAIRFHLHMLEATDHFPSLDVVMKSVAPLRVLSMFVNKDLQMTLVAAEFRKLIANRTIRYAGQGIDQLREDELDREFNLESSPHEIMLVVKADQPGDVTLSNGGVLVLREEPPIETTATLILQGGERAERLEVLSLLQRWVVARGYRLGNRVRALSHIGPLDTMDRSKWITEFQLAVDFANGEN